MGRQHFINTCVSVCICAFGHVCVSVQACGCAHVCVFECAEIHEASCVIQMTPMSVWVSPRCGRCMDHVVRSTRGHIGSIVLGSSLNVALNLHRVKEWLTSSARPPDASEVHRRSVLDQPPAGRIRCYLSDWEHYHQSLLSTSLCPDSNRHRVIHLRWWRADKISNRVCQNFAMFAWCVKEVVIMYLSLHATGSALRHQRTLW